MFETALLDKACRGRKPWPLAGILVQAAAVAALILVPMIHPEVLSVVLPRTTLYVPAGELKSAPPPPAKAATAQHSSSAHIAPARRNAFVAPSRWSNPVALIDDGGLEMPSFLVGNPLVQAASAPLPGSGRIAEASLPPPPPPKPESPRQQEPAKPIRVGGQVQEANIIHRVLPAYPPLARAARIAGAVRLEGVISREGGVQQLRVISGHPLLVQAALEAVRQWRYRPTLLNGEPVAVIAPIEVNFLLSR